MRRTIRLALLAAPLFGACSEQGAPLDPVDPSECNDASSLATCMPAWSAYSPPEDDLAPVTEGQPAIREVVENLERATDSGLVNLGSHTFVCTDKLYRFVDNPERAMSFNIDESVVWPGALVQGSSHKTGSSVTSLRALPIVERAPVTVTMTFNNQDNTRVVADPNSGTVRSAVGSMIGNAEAAGLATANNIDFSSETYSSERQAARSFGVSGRYLAFEARASGSLNRSTTTNTVAAKFVQQMYVSSISQPPTPQAFFSGAFGPAQYQAQAGLGNIGANNPPLYVSRIGYGRMMVFAMTAKAEVTDIKAALDATWKGVGSGASFKLGVKDSTVVASSELRITQVGGDDQNAINAIKSGKLADYFTNTAPLTSAAPIWFELKSLTGEVALVSEPGTYTETTCIPRLPGTFDYKAEVGLTIPFTAGTQRQVTQADVNGDNRMDLVYNERRSGPALNRVHVAFADATGGFTIASPSSSVDNPGEGWESYQMVVADVDGDGRDDLVWNHRAANNVVYTAMSNGDGSFTWRPRQVHTAQGWSAFTVATGDLNGDGKTDLVWNSRASGTVTRTYFGLARADSSFAMFANFRDIAGNFSGYAPAKVARMNGDAYADVVLNSIGATFNNTYVLRFTPTSDSTGTLATSLHQWPGTWPAGYQLFLGNTDGTNATDLVWVRMSGSTYPRTFPAMNNGSAAFSNKGLTEPSILNPVQVYVADFNNDGRDDLLYNRRQTGTSAATNVNELIVGFGLSNGTFSIPAGTQRHPNTPGVGWAAYDQVFTGDVNGDGRADILWTSPSGDAKVYVALAR